MKTRKTVNVERGLQREDIGIGRVVFRYRHCLTNYWRKDYEEKSSV